MVEVIVVVLIIAILVTFALPQFANTRERAFDNEAKANLKLIQAAEKIYKMEMGAYYDATGAAQINSSLKLSLPVSSKWSYDIQNVTATTADSVATRVGAGGRVWRLLINQDDPACSGSGCP